MEELRWEGTSGCATACMEQALSEQVAGCKLSSKAGDAVTSSSILFQWLTTPMAKIGKPEWPFFQTVSSCLLCTTEWLDIRSALPFLFSRLNHARTLCLPSYILCSRLNHCKDILRSPSRMCIFLLPAYSFYRLTLLLFIIQKPLNCKKVTSWKECEWMKNCCWSVKGPHRLHPPPCW